MTVWSPPDGLVRRSGTLTVSTGMFGTGDHRCPAGDALKARGFRPLRGWRRKPEALEEFTFRPFMAALDRLERAGSNGAGASARPVHEGVLRWTAHAVERYRAAFPADPAHPLVAADEPWFYQHRRPAADDRGTERYRMTVWGRCLRSPDGRTRELRMPVHRLRDGHDDVQSAVAAFVVAEGTPGPPPEHVRVVRFALLDGRVDPVFTGTRREAVALYRERGADAVRALLDGGAYRPGGACVSCAFTSVCPALPRAPGLLGVNGGDRPRRSWSVTNGRSYAVCPARDYLRRQHLPAAERLERGATAERGRAVHAYLAARHGAPHATACSPEIPGDWVPQGYALPPEERRLSAALLRHHARVCPLRSGAGEVRVEPRLVFHDTTADTMVVAAPDLLYRDGGSWVWREVKTTAKDRRAWRDPLEHYPQLALAVLLMGGGALGGTRAAARVELEVLRPGGPDLVVIDPFTPAVLATARDVVRRLVRDWRADDAYAPRPGAGCATCEVARWCPSHRAEDQDGGAR